jgi:coproporphyrinogen III oxidase-like Fe-S oxidoreductase
MGAWSADPPDSRAPFGARRMNLRDLDAYLGRCRQGLAPDAGPRELLAEATARGEAVFLALRTVRGLDAAGFAAEFGSPPRAFFAREIDELAAAGLLEEVGGSDLRLTPRGRLVSDAVFERFVCVDPVGGGPVT